MRHLKNLEQKRQDRNVYSRDERYGFLGIDQPVIPAFLGVYGGSPRVPRSRVDPAFRTVELRLERRSSPESRSVERKADGDGG
jgi:hypothetical protein